MLANIQAIRKVNPTVIGWVYRVRTVGVRTQPSGVRKRQTLRPSAPQNGIKALPWHTTVRTLLEDRAQWGLFMPIKGCMPAPGQYVCGPDATHNLCACEGAASGGAERTPQRCRRRAERTA